MPTIVHDVIYFAIFSEHPINSRSFKNYTFKNLLNGGVNNFLGEIIGSHVSGNANDFTASGPYFLSNGIQLLTVDAGSKYQLRGATILQTFLTR